MELYGISVWFILLFPILATGTIWEDIGKHHQSYKEGETGDPLFLTPLIESGEITQAQELARVNSVSGIESYAGFLTVNKEYDSNIYFWFFPAESQPESVPLLLWLNGGPGSSSLFGMFGENGVFFVDENITLHQRPIYWSQKYSVVYIDNPVGAGFSFTQDERGYARNQTHVARDLYEALLQFFTLFPDYQKNDFYATGESYAGKYIPSISYKIHIENPTAGLKINFKGMAIGNGICDPETMMDFSNYLYQLGLIDSNERIYFEKRQNMIVENIQAEQYLQAFLVGENLLEHFINVTGYTNFYNYLQVTPTPDYYEEFFNKPEVRLAMHVGNLTFHSYLVVFSRLSVDFMKSVKPWVQILLDAGYKTLIYSGQLDIIVPYPHTENFLNSLQWSLENEYKQSPRKQWIVNERLAGYVRSVGNFSEVLVRNAGHYVPLDQPEWALDLITKFVSDIPLAP